MSPDDPSAAEYEFGPYRVDVGGRRLLRGGDTVALSPKAFDALLVLLQRRGKVVDKKALMDLLWPGTFVEEGNLTQTIFVLRKVLGTDEHGRQYIDTVPRRGYRFAPPDSPVRPSAAASRDAAEETTSRARRTWIYGAIVLVAIVVVSGSLAWRHARAQAADPAYGKTRIVVLPFENLTRQEADDWLSGAFSDAITTGLRDLESLIVVSRDRIAELYASRGITRTADVSATAIRSVSEPLGVRLYVRGTYQRVGDQLRVTAAVTDAQSGAIQAQEVVTGGYGELLRLEDDLAGKLASSLRASRPASRKLPTTSMEAYRLYTEAEALYDRADELQAIPKLKEAVSLDPRYAAAWALLSKCYSRAAAPSAPSGGPGVEYPREAEADALRAVDLDPSLYEAHIARALAARANLRIDEWRAEAETAISLNPRLAEGYELLADVFFAPPALTCARPRDPARAEQLYRQALAIDPRLAVAYGNLTYHLHFLLRFSDALRTADQGLSVLPGNAAILRARSTALMFAGRLDEAVKDIDAVSHGRRDLSIQDRWVLASIDERHGDLDRAAEGYREVIGKDPSNVYEVSIARVYLADGHETQAAQHLRQAIGTEPACGRYVAESPAFAPYRSLPQIAALLPH